MDNDEMFKAIQRDFIRFIEQDNQHARGQTEKIVESIVLGFLFLVSFLANGIICIVLLQSNHRQSASSVLLLSLIFANFFISLLFIPFVIVSVITDEWLFGPTWCEMYGFLTSTLFTGSNLSIVAIAIHRYYFVVKPLTLKIDVHRAYYFVGFLWISSLTCAVPPLFGWNCYTYSPGKAHCTLSWRIGGPALVYLVYYVLMTFLIPLAIILFAYRAIYRKSRKKRKLGAFASRELSTNAHIPRATSPQSNDPHRLTCGCFSKSASVKNNNLYIQREPMVSSISSTSFSFDSSTQNLPGRQSAHERKEALRRQVSRHSSVIQQRTFQSVSAIVVSFVVCLSPYFLINMWSLFSQTTPHLILDFMTSWLFLSITAVNPMTHGYSNRQIRRAIKRLPLVKRFVKQGRDRAYQMDPSTHYRPTARTVPRTISQGNEAFDIDN